jgi:hypothetical protein
MVISPSPLSPRLNQMANAVIIMRVQQYYDSERPSIYLQVISLIRIFGFRRLFVHSFATSHALATQ